MSFPKARRFTRAKVMTPGPGSYEVHRSFERLQSIGHVPVQIGKGGARFEEHECEAEYMTSSGVCSTPASALRTVARGKSFKEARRSVMKQCGVVRKFDLEDPESKPISEAQQLVESLKQELAIARDQLIATQVSLHESSEQHQQLKRELVDAEQRHATRTQELEQNIWQVEQQVDILNDRLLHETNSAQEMTSRNLSLIQQLDAREKHHKKIEEELIHLRTAHEKSQSRSISKDGHILQLQARFEALAEETASLRVENKALEDIIETKSKQTDAAELREKYMDDQLTHLNAAYSDQQACLSSKDEHILAMQAQIEALEEEKERMRVKVERMETENFDISTRFRECIKERNELTEAAVKAAEKDASRERVINNLKSEVERHCQRFGDLQAEHQCFMNQQMERKVEALRICQDFVVIIGRLNEDNEAVRRYAARLEEQNFNLAIVEGRENDARQFEHLSSEDFSAHTIRLLTMCEDNELLRQKLVQLQDEFNSTELIAEKNREEVAEAEAHIKNLNQDLLISDELVEVLRVDNAQAKARIQQLQIDLEQKIGECDRSEVKVNEQDHKLLQALRALDEQVTYNVARDREFAALVEQKEWMSRRIDELDENVALELNRATSAENKVLEAEKHIIALSQSLEDFRVSLLTTEEALTAKGREVEELNENIQVRDRVHEDEKEAMKHLYDDHMLHRDTINNQLHQKLAAAMELSESADARVSTLVDQVNKSMRSNEQLQSELTQLKERCEADLALVAESERMEQRLKDMEIEFSLNSSEFAQTKRKLEELAEQNAALISHHNPDQRIRLHLKIKEENRELHECIRKLKKKLLVARQQLEDAVFQNKEDSDNSKENNDYTERNGSPRPIKLVGAIAASHGRRRHLKKRQCVLGDVLAL